MEKDAGEKTGDKPSAKPPVTTPKTNPPSDPSPVVEPKPKDPDPKPKDPDPKPKDPDPKPKDPPLKPKDTDPKTPDVKAVSFKEVQPILRAYCFECHGGSTKKPDGGVDVTSIAKMLKSKGPPLVQGKPDDSAIWLTLKAGDMPPDGKKKPSDKEKQLIHDWIASGAKERRRPIRVRISRRMHPARRMELTSGAEAG
jgi:hypothetical protein